MTRTETRGYKIILHTIKLYTFKLLLRPLTAALAVLLIAIPLAGCDGEKEENSIANYGSFGADIATTLANSFPYRSPGSAQEKAASVLIAAELQELGYLVWVQEFSYTDNLGVRKNSQNIICNLEGSGFIKLDAEGKDTEERIDDRWNVIGAHYDVPVTGRDYQPAVEPAQTEQTDVEEQEEDEGADASGGQAADPAEQEETTTETGIGAKDDLDTIPWQMEREIPVPVDFSTYDGINSNASGVAAVLTAAKEMLTDQPGYDVEFVLFGAGTDDFAGARAYIKSLSAADMATLEAMYNLEGIYAGDKVYAHAGTNSVLTGNAKDYEMRRKLYEVTDVFYNYRLNSNNNYSLYTNQSALLVNAGKGGSSIFSEWTSRQSDHTPFDQTGIPVVYFESGEYNIKSLDELGVESKNPSFSSTGGKISGTPFDSSSYLETLFKNMAEPSSLEQLYLTPTPQPSESEPAATDETAAVDSEATESTAEADMRDIPRLEQRINNTAFILVKAMQREPSGSRSVSR